MKKKNIYITHIAANIVKLMIKDCFYQLNWNLIITNVEIESKYCL